MAELKSFLFTDICRSVDLKNEMIGRSVTERDMAFIEQILTPHRERIEEHLEENTGRVVSTAGDGHFLVFNNTILAALWATEVQNSHRENPIVTPDGGKVEVRISMHVGVPQIDPGDPDNFIGKSVDYASRLNDYATGEQILVSRSVMAILDDVGLEGISFHLHGRRQLKGIGNVEVHELLYDDRGPRPLRKQPSEHSRRQWTVVPTMGFSQGEGGDGDTLVSTERLTRVGNYELESLLGSGGMGDVYKGRHIQFGRLRAIKVIKPQFVAAGNEEVIRRFYQEIKAVGALEHKNVVVAIDSSSPSDRLHYLVMEYIDGISIEELVQQLGHLSVPDACEIIRQAARGLQYIHRNGMVHRDIKPSNLILTLAEYDGLATDTSPYHDAGEVEAVVKILDLGLALLAGDDSERLTRFDSRAMGTGMYMSPEQWRTTSVDIRADIYSLGCTLYHLLAGNPPYLDSDLKPEKAHEKSRLPPITTANIPRKLWQVIQKMLAKRPENRYSTPAEVAAELAAFSEGHDLVSLARVSSEPTTSATSLRPTRVETGSRVDTWLSRVSQLSVNPRTLLKWGASLAVIASIFFVLLYWTAQRIRMQTIEAARINARLDLPGLARDIAHREIGREITSRFRILQDAASEANLIELMADYDPERARVELEQHPLLQWIKEHRRENMDTARADSWFINDRYGRQIARDPVVEQPSGRTVDSFLENYAWRDYFHGQGRDLPKDHSEKIQPIEEPNISAAYTSDSTGKLKVAFSVPIWSRPLDEEPREVIGVLSMSVDLGEFKILEPHVKRGREVLLVDLRDDYLERDPADPSRRVANRGLILDHPRQAPWTPDAGPPRVSFEVLHAMDEAENGEFISDYDDPIPSRPGATYWGGFEPVVYEVRDVVTGDPTNRKSGWMVLVQEIVFSY